MTKFLLPLLALTVAAPAFAAPAAQVAPISFERDGISFIGTVETRGELQLISGREVQSGRPFDLVVKKGRVSGTYGDARVSYPVAQK